MSYTIEVYRGKQAPERNFLVYSLYVLFYPQLVAGPIERPQNVLPQLHVFHPFEAGRATRGLRRMLVGFFKKVVVADRLAVIVNAIYGSPRSWHGSVLVLATLCFTFQIYADFSGYSDIALGSAEVMGIRLMTNFRQPYMSRSVSEFWTRWHISLSTWFRDYVYIPLGGNRVTPWRRRFNQLATFLLSGLWHGANWTYVLWGGLNGLYLIAEHGVVAHDRGRARPAPAYRLGITFLLITIAWVFFRASTVRDALFILSHSITDSIRFFHPSVLLEALSRINVTAGKLATTIGALALLLTADREASKRGVDTSDLFEHLPTPARWGLYYGGAIAIITLGYYGRQQFIYFQF